MRIGVYPGSFDPVTYGHIDIIKRSSKLCDMLIVGILDNSEKIPLFTLDEKINMLEKVTKELDNVQIDSFSGLLVDYVSQKKAEVIVRGLRAVSDYEYEIQLAHTNYSLCSEVETVFLMTKSEYSFLSSSMVKEVARYGGDTSKMVPPITTAYLREKFQI